MCGVLKMGYLHFQEAKLLAIASQVERVLGKPYEVLGQMPAW